MLPLLGHDALHNGSLQRQSPVLLACIVGDDRAQIEEMLEQVTKKLQHSLNAYIVDEQSLTAVMENFAVAGTPTFLLLRHGIETGRLLGKANAETLHRFLAKQLSMNGNK